MKGIYILFAIAFISLAGKAQVFETPYVLQTSLDSVNSVFYEGNTGSLQLNSLSGDLIFSTNLANFKTGNKRVDSLLAQQQFVIFTFTANLGQNVFTLINDQNTDKYSKVIGFVIVNSVSYNTEAQVRLKNLNERSDMSKALVELKLEIDPKIVKIPYLSDYFKNILMFQVNNGYFNQNK